ncbi:MAG: hypothetical protein GY789_10490 [Hyphomicrobiales bacterium]|nr:hypothetical protein [Hyphomicrobiales bacterium]
MSTAKGEAAVAKRAAASSLPVIAVLNDRWRVTFDPLQWILEVRKSRGDAKSTGWRGRRFCTTRTVLIRDVHELCGDVDPNALAVLERLPEKHPHYAPRVR